MGSLGSLPNRANYANPTNPPNLENPPNPANRANLPNLANRANLANQANQSDPLPSWNSGAAKQAILDLVDRVTKSGSPDFVPMTERVATFDNDGTLWVEKPLPVEVYFILARVRELALRDPSLKARPAVKAALDGDTAYFHEHGPQAILDLLQVSHAGMSQDDFRLEVERFFRAGRHPTLRQPFVATVYEPMIELLSFLRANGFDIWICSGGTVDFMRVVAPTVYGVAIDHVIGSEVARDSRFVDGRRVIWRLPQPGTLNDKEVKPVTIDERIGRRPVLAAGNVGNAGDIAMLEFSKGRRGASLQLLVNHDDAAREFAYAEKDEISLEAARKHSFTVVSVKNDWHTVFSSATR